MQNKSFNKLEIMFKIGEKVVCVNGNFNERIHNEIYPKQNEFYTIRKIDINAGIYLEEIINQKDYYLEGFMEVGFNENRFRKLDYEFADNLLAEISEAMKSETILN